MRTDGVPELISTPRGRFNVAVSGEADKPTLVFVAGLGDDLHSWDPVVQLFDEYRCVTFDNRGCGASDAPDDVYDIPELSADGQAIVETIGLQSYFLIGSSMGGAIVQEWLLKDPGRVRGAVITNSWAQSDEYLSTLFEHWYELAHRGSPVDLVTSATLFSFSPSFHARGMVDTHDTSWLNRAGFAAGARACSRHATLSRLPTIDTPTLVIAGEQDILTRLEHSVQMATLLPGGSLKTVPAGHMTFVEEPRLWTTLVKNWIEALPADSDVAPVGDASSTNGS